MCACHSHMPVPKQVSRCLCLCDFPYDKQNLRNPFWLECHFPRFGATYNFSIHSCVTKMEHFFVMVLKRTEKSMSVLSQWNMVVREECMDNVFIYGFKGQDNNNNYNDNNNDNDVVSSIYLWSRNCLSHIRACRTSQICHGSGCWAWWSSPAGIFPRGCGHESVSVCTWSVQCCIMSCSPWDLRLLGMKDCSQAHIYIYIYIWLSVFVVTLLLSQAISSNRGKNATSVSVHVLWLFKGSSQVHTRVWSSMSMILPWYVYSSVRRLGSRDGRIWNELSRWILCPKVSLLFSDLYSEDIVHCSVNPKKQPVEVG